MKTLRSKTCSTCRKSLLLPCFAPSVQTRDGLRYLCRECTGEYFRAWKEKRLAMRPRLTLWRVAGTPTVRRIAVTSAGTGGERGREDSLT